MMDGFGVGAFNTCIQDSPQRLLEVRRIVVCNDLVCLSEAVITYIAILEDILVEYRTMLIVVSLWFSVKHGEPMAVTTSSPRLLTRPIKVRKEHFWAT